MKTAKFWIYWNESQILLKLKDGEEINLFKHFQHDEGYSKTFIKYYRKKARITCEEITFSRDCDGRYEDRRQTVALIGNCPNLQWRESDHVTRDYSAETAGY